MPAEKKVLDGGLNTFFGTVKLNGKPLFARKFSAVDTHNGTRDGQWGGCIGQVKEQAWQARPFGQGLYRFIHQ